MPIRFSSAWKKDQALQPGVAYRAGKGRTTKQALSRFTKNNGAKYG